LETDVTDEPDEILAGLALHRLMTADQVHRLYLPHLSLRTAGNRLRALRELGLANDVPQRRAKPGDNRPKLWYATAAGVDCASHHPATRNCRLVTLTEQKARGGNQEHTVAVNEACIAISCAAEKRGGHASWQNEMGHALDPASGAGYYFVADALMTFDVAHDGVMYPFRLLLEMDRDTKDYNRVLEQVRRFLHYRRYRPTNGLGWEAQYPPIPRLQRDGFPTSAWVFDCGNAERRLRDFAALVTDPNRAPDLATADKDITLLLTTADRLHGGDPFDDPMFFNPHTRQWVNIIGQRVNTPESAQLVSVAR
jgi:hypothetical protein